MSDLSAMQVLSLQFSPPLSLAFLSLPLLVRENGSAALSALVCWFCVTAFRRHSCSSKWNRRGKVAGWSNATSTDPYSCVAIGNLMCGVGYHIFAECSYGIWIYHAILNDHLCAALITAFIGGAGAFGREL